jgi:hypothetical protein
MEGSEKNSSIEMNSSYWLIISLPWTAPFLETACRLEDSGVHRFWTFRKLRRRMRAAGKAETGSAGEQPVKEYPVGNSFR